MPAPTPHPQPSPPREPCPKCQGLGFREFSLPSEGPLDTRPSGMAFRCVACDGTGLIVASEMKDERTDR